MIISLVCIFNEIMGVKLLNKFLINNFYNNGVYNYHISMLSNKKICIDISIFLYKYAINQKTLLKNIFKMCSVFKTYNILPLFVFDGKAPDIKQDIINKRKLDRYNAKIKYAKMLEKYKKSPSSKTLKELELLVYDTIKISKNDVNVVKRLIRLCGFNFLEASGEADELCAALVKNKKVHGCLSDDMDLFVYGTRHIYRNFDLNTCTLTYYNLNIILKKMNMPYDDFTLFCIISGIDYYNSPHNIFYNYKIYQKFIKSQKKNYYFYLIHNKYIQDNDMKLLDTREMFTLKQKNILSNFNINITSNNYKLNEINKLITT